MSWGIAYKDDPNIPATQGGRTLARVETFATKELADAWLADTGRDDFYAVETDPAKPLQAFFPKGAA